VQKGKKWLTAQVDELLACQAPKTWIVLVGYSQGAQVVGDVYQSLSRSARDRIAGVVLFGDPYFNGHSQATFGGFDYHSNGVLGTRPIFRTHLHRIRSYCFKRDYICQGDYASKISDIRFVGSHAHSEYSEKAAKQAGSWIAKRVRSLITTGSGPTLFLNPTGGWQDPSYLELWYKGWLGATGLPIDSLPFTPSDLSPFRCVVLDDGFVGKPGDYDWSADRSALESMNAYMLGGGTVIGLGEWGPDRQTTRLNRALDALGLSMRLRGQEIDPTPVAKTPPFVTDKIEPSPLTAGVDDIVYAATDAIELSPPAAALVRTLSTEDPMVAVQGVGGGRFVLTGDTLHHYDGHDTDASGNRQLIRNLCGPAA
jgi:hypothetical protein